MHLVFDIFQGIGIAAAVGVRPFLPALAVGALAAGDVQIDFVGALAAGDVQIDFAHSDFSFLQSPAFLLVMVVGSIVLSMLERRMSEQQLERGPIGLALAAAAVAIGALLFAGALAQGHYAWWPGIVGGVICAGVGILATRPLLTRVRTRLDREAVGALPVFTEAVALAGAVLSVLAPPVGILLLGFLLWLLYAGRRRGEQKYAGLRILR